MRHVLVGLALCTFMAVAGCGRGGDPADFGAGDSDISGGTGGEGSGPTGTQGGESAINPAADSTNTNGTDGE